MIWKKRKIKSYDVDLDPSILAIYPKERPDWTAWFTWLYPLLNVSLLTPAVVLTAETAVFSTYALISVNIVISVWQTGMLLHNLVYDRGNFSRHLVNVFLVIGATFLATQVAWMTLPLTIPDAPHLVKAFFVANFVSSFINFANTACLLMLPWLQKHARSMYAWFRGRPLGVIRMPSVLEERSRINDEYFYHDAVLKEMPRKLTSTHLKQEKEPPQQAVYRLRTKFHNLCYQYRQRKLANFAGVLTQVDKLKKVEKFGRRVFKEGKLSLGSDPSDFFYSRMHKYFSKLSFRTKQLTEIQDLHQQLQDSPEDAALFKQFLHRVNSAVTIDQLSAGLDTLSSDEGVTSEQIEKMLVEYVSSEGKDGATIAQELVTLSEALLAEPILHYALRLHDEVGLGVKELLSQLENNYLKKFDNLQAEAASEFVGRIVAEHLEKRKTSGETVCPFEFHECAHHH